MPTTEASPSSQEAFEQDLAEHLQTRKQTERESLTADEIRQGVSFDRLETLAQQLHLRQETLTRVLGISERTLQRRNEQGHLSATESDRFERLMRVYRHALRAFDDDLEDARDWLTSSKSALDGETPIEHLDTEPGTQIVLQMLIVIDQTIPA
jgi:putative toxin-antitoxin system antitoxin component (TIGR02293 family)